MRIDYALVRQILLAIESGKMGGSEFNADLQQLASGFKFNDKKNFYEDGEPSKENILVYHLRYLVEKDFLRGIRFSVSGRQFFPVFGEVDLTCAGRDWLKLVRDDSVFSKVIEKLTKVGGLMTFELIKSEILGL